MDQQPPKKKKFTGLCKPYRLSPELSAIVGVEISTRAQLMKMLLKYIKAKRLSDPRNGQYFHPDFRMVRVFGYGRLRSFSMSKFLTAHLRELEDN